MDETKTLAVPQRSDLNATHEQFLRFCRKWKLTPDIVAELTSWKIDYVGDVMAGMVKANRELLREMNCIMSLGPRMLQALGDNKRLSPEMTAFLKRIMVGARDKDKMVGYVSHVTRKLIDKFKDDPDQADKILEMVLVEYLLTFETEEERIDEMIMFLEANKKAQAV